MAKGWKLSWRAPKTVMVAEPLELSIQRSKNPPARVRIEVYESDAKKHEVDDYNDKLKKRTEDKKDDLIIEFEGTLTERPGGGSLFVPESGTSVLGKSGGSDHVVITFEGSTKTFACGVPHTGGDEPVDGASDGAFYELYAKLFDATSPDGALLATTDVHLVRRRTDVLLAVEPLNQCDASLKNAAMGRMVLKFFHGGNNGTSDRGWGQVLVGTSKIGDPIAKTICDIGCNYVVLTMALRYIRRPDPSVAESEKDLPPAEKTWISLFDEFVEPELDGAFKPFLKADKKAKSYKRFSMTPAEINSTSKALFEEHKGTWKEAPKFVAGTSFSDVTGADADAVQASRTTRATIPKHWWVPRLVWWVRRKETEDSTTNPADADDTVEGAPSTWVAKKKGGGTETLDAVHPDGTPVLAYRMKHPLPVGDFASKESFRVEPPYKGALRKALKLRVTSLDMSSSTTTWEAKLKKHLDKGLPAIAHVKSGRYLLEGKDPGGHYVLVVGYRKTGGVTRFIVNDPAGIKKLQYECFREEDVAATQAKRAALTSLVVSFSVKREGADSGQVGQGSESFTQAELDGTLAGTSIERSVTVGEGDNQATVKLVFEGGVSGKTVPFPPKKNKKAKKSSLLGFRYSVEVSAAGATTLVAKNQSAAKKTGKTSGTLTVAASHSAPSAEGTSAMEIALKFEGAVKTATGTRLPRPWEGRVDGLVERRRRDSLFALHFLEPTYTWEKGAAQWLVFDGKVT
ncbi:MAG: C39 family peptidase [Nannocystales bacterium]